MKQISKIGTPMHVFIENKRKVIVFSLCYTFLIKKKSHFERITLKKSIYNNYKSKY